MTCIRNALVLLTLALSGCASMKNDQVSKSLAPTGPMRIAYLSGPLYASKDPASGELRGIAVDLSQGLAKRLRTTPHATAHTNPAAIMASAKAGEVDVALMGVSAERAAAFDFSSPYMEVEQGYLVRAGLAVRTAAEVDQRDIRVGVVENTGADQFLGRNLRSATLVRVKSLQELEPLLASGQVDVIAATKTFLYGRLVSLPNARVLDGRILVESIAFALPKGKDAVALAFVNEFVQDAKTSGLVAGAIERAGLKGVSVAP